MAKIMIGEYEGSIYPDGNGYRGAIDLGFDAKGRRQRVKRRGRTKAQVKDKLKEAVADLEAGVTTDARYSVEDAVNDFLAKGLKGRAKGTVDNYRSLADHNVIPQIGSIKLKELTADHLDDWLDERAEELSADAPTDPLDHRARDPPGPGPRQGAPERREPGRRTRGPGRTPL